MNDTWIARKDGTPFVVKITEDGEHPAEKVAAMLRGLANTVEAEAFHAAEDAKQPREAR